MELKEFTGKKMLDGVDFENKSIKTWGENFEDCEVCRFRLDGVVYSAIEDPDDGYRSHMNDLIINELDDMTNAFEPIEVLCRYRDKGDYGSIDDILELVDTSTSKVVLEVGTSNTDDYYPCFVASFDPTAMVTNDDKEDI
jgi:hypothetical protein